MRIELVSVAVTNSCPTSSLKLWGRLRVAVTSYGIVCGLRAAKIRGPAARVRAWLAREFGDFLRIREVDTPEAILLAPAQQQLLRDRFRLGVLDLRQAILARDERAVRAEAGALDALLEHYFDPNQPEVAAAQAQLRLAAAAVVPAATVTLDETLVALHAARAGNDG
jgi:uncharacterized protein HemX